MIADIPTPPINLPSAQKQTTRLRLPRLPSLQWPSLRRPLLSNVGKGLASIAILAATTGLVLIRAPHISRTAETSQTNAPQISQANVTPASATEPPVTATSTPTAPASASNACSNQVWPYIAANCLQGQTQPDAARMAVDTPQPEAQKPSQNTGDQLREASKPELLLRVEPDQLSRQETREERRARRYEERRARYEEQRAQYEARYEERRSRYEERRARRFDFGF